MSQPINLSKGGRINLSKTAPGLKKVSFGLGWKPNAYATGTDFDADASAFVCNASTGAPKLINNEHFVFYGNTQLPNKSVTHSGDNRRGDADLKFTDTITVDEIITVNLDALDAAVDEISMIVTIHEAVERKQNFGQITNCVVAIRNDETGEVLGVYNLEEDFSNETAVQFGSLYKKDGQWLFKAVGAGFNKGLADFVVAYGGTLA